MIGAPEEPLDSYWDWARHQQARVDRLLACRRHLRLIPDKGGARDAEVRWSGDIVDPEFQKNLRIFYRLIAGSIELCQRARSSRASEAHGGRVGSQEPVHGLLGHLDHLRDLITLPTGTRLTLKILLAHRFELEQALVELSDEQYLRRRAAELYDEGEGTAVTWKKLFAEPPPLLRHVTAPTESTNARGGQATTKHPDNRKVGEAAGEDEIEQTRLMLARLLATKETEDLTLRARRELKQSALLFVVPTLLVTTSLFALAIGRAENGDGELLLAATAGADGAALGALLRLRDEIRFGAHIREFISFFLGQIVVGVAAGLFALLAVRSEVLRVGGDTAGLGALAFAVGFSEAALLGLVGRIGERRVDAGEERSRARAGTEP